MAQERRRGLCCPLSSSDYTTQTSSITLRLVIFSDDTALVGCISGGDETEYRQLVDNFVAWNECYKDQGMVVDFRRARPELSTISILGDKVQVVLESYKYLGVHMNNKLDWKQQTEAVYKKGQSRLYFLRKLRSFNVYSKMLCMFYQSVVASAIFFAAISWGQRHQGL